MTEDEAKTKWCPFVRITPSTEDHHGLTNRGDVLNRDGISMRCIGSACMAWDFNEQEYERGEPLPIGAVPADSGWEPTGEIWCAGGEYGSGQKRMNWRRALPRSGYCRAFGRS